MVNFSKAFSSLISVPLAALQWDSCLSFLNVGIYILLAVQQVVIRDRAVTVDVILPN